MVEARVAALRDEAAGYARRLARAEAGTPEAVVLEGRLEAVQASIRAMTPVVVGDPVVHRRPRKAREARA